MNNDEKKILNDNEFIENEKNNIEYDLIIEQLQKNFDLESNKLKNVIKDQEKNIIYLKSDIENIKRHSLKEIQNSVNRHISKVINEFLLVFDDFQRSIEYAKEYQNNDILNGLLITYNSFLKVLKDLEVIEVDTTDSFNPELHDAISSITDASKESNTIAQVIQKGFMYKTQVLRPAKVIIFS